MLKTKFNVDTSTSITYQGKYDTSTCVTYRRQMWTLTPASHTEGKCGHFHVRHISKANVDISTCVTNVDTFTCDTYVGTFTCDTNVDTFTCVRNVDSFTCVTNVDTFTCVTNVDTFTCVTNVDTALTLYAALSSVDTFIPFITIGMDVYFQRRNLN